MLKLKLVIFGLLAIAVISTNAFASPPFYEESTSFSTYYNTSTLTVIDNYVEIYFESMFGDPLWIETTYTENGSVTYAHEGGGGGDLVSGCVEIDELFEVCREDIQSDVIELTARPIGEENIVEFLIQDQVTQQGYYFEIEATGGIEEAPDTRFITNDEITVARVKLFK